MRIPHAQANLAKIPAELKDEQVVLLADIASTGISGAEALSCLRPGGTLSSLGVYSGKLELPYTAFAAGLGDHRVVTTLCPGGKERMRRLLELVRTKRLDLTPLWTHSFKLEDIQEAYALFGERREGVVKVALRP